MIGVRSGFWCTGANRASCALLFAALFAVISPLPGRCQAPDPRFARIAELLADSNAADALPVAKSLVGDLEKQGGTAVAGFVDALDLLIDASVTSGTPTPAVVELVDREVKLKSGFEGPESVGVAKTLSLLGTQYFRTGDYKTAIATLERALAIEEAHETTPVGQLTRTLNVLGQGYSESDQGARAVSTHQRSLALAQKEFGAESREAGAVLSLLGGDERARGDLKAAKDYVTRSTKILEASGPERLDTAVALGILGSIYRELGDVAGAIPLMRRAIAGHEKVLGPDHLRLAAQYNNLGLALNTSGDTQAARTALEHALAISEKNLGPDATATATVLGNLGIALAAGGDNVGARDVYERALTIQEKRLGPEHRLVAGLLFSLGMALGHTGDMKAGRQRIERSFAIYEKTLGPENPKTLQVLTNLADFMDKTGDTVGARAAFERAWKAEQRTLGDDNPFTADSLFQLARFDEDTNPALAKTRFEAALKVQEAVPGPPNPRIPNTLLGLARAEINLRDYAAALPLLRRASGIWTGLYGTGFPSRANALAGEANALLHLGRSDQAFRVALDSAEVRRANVLTITRNVGEVQALEVVGSDREGLNIALQLAPHASPEGRAEVWNALIEERALVLDEMGRRHRVARNSANPEVAALALNVANARDLLARTVVVGPGDRAKTYTDRVQALHDQLEVSERALARASVAFRRDLQAEQVGLPEVVAALPAHSALIGYVHEGSSYLAFVIASGQKTPVAVLLGTAEKIESQVAAWRSQIDVERDSLGRAAKQNEASYRVAGSALRRSVWDPLAAYLVGARQVFIVPDGALQVVNFAALPSGQSGYLVETGPVLNFLSAERDLAAPAVPGSATELLSVGNPAFSASKATGLLISDNTRYRGNRAACPGFASLDFPELPGSAGEVQAINKIWRDQGLPVNSLTGSRATEGALKEQVAGKRVVHLATHGFFLGKDCRTTGELRENPLLRSGLALAGANHRATAGPNDEDGILTAEEVASLDLDGVDWVVLSGCDTGLGDIQEGEGVLGLRRAFQVAGARTLISSLWSVGDEDARDWMVALYRSRFVRGTSTAQAVRVASTASLRSRRAAGKTTHPFYWAGFIAVGSPEVKP